jgi:hypothetical protein
MCTLKYAHVLYYVPFQSTELPVHRKSPEPVIVCLSIIACVCAAAVFNVFNGALHVGIKSFARSAFVSLLKDSYSAEPGMDSMMYFVSSRV